MVNEAMVKSMMKFLSLSVEPLPGLAPGGTSGFAP